MQIITLAKQIKRSQWSYESLIQIAISRQNLLHNLHQFQKEYPALTFAPVLKSNAYGHGLSLVASALDKELIAFFAIDSLFEAKVLRNDRIASPILVIGFVTPESIVNNTVRNVAFTITSLEQLQAVTQLTRKKTVIHLKVDTGLYRQGLLPEEIETATQLIKSNTQLKLEGLCSHLSDADSDDSKLTEKQIRIWQTVVWQIKQTFSSVSYFHLAASAGTEYSRNFESNVARLGAGLYGFNRSPFKTLDLKPVLSMTSIIGSIKTIPAGARIGYNGTFTAKKPVTIATVPVGYYEGIDRRLSNRGCLQVNGTHCPIVGRVSMNITTIDISALQGVKLGDPVTIISDKSDDLNSVESMADSIDTVPHEILVHLPSSLRRELKL